MSSCKLVEENLQSEYVPVFCFKLKVKDLALISFLYACWRRLWNINMQIPSENHLSLIDFQWSVYTKKIST